MTQEKEPRVGRVGPEVRAAIVSRARRGGVTQKALAAKYGLSNATVGRILRLAKERDETFTKPQAASDL